MELVLHEIKLNFKHIALDFDNRKIEILRHLKFDFVEKL